MTAALRVERHPLGPRLHVLGHRVHECHLGLILAAATLAAALLGGPALPLVAAGALAAWLLAKDWRDLHPATRDTAAWGVGIHRRPDAPPRPALRHRVPALAALATVLAGAVNVASAMTSELPARVGALLSVAPAGEVRLAHALALPAGLALLGVSWPLARRRRRALYVAVGLLAAVGVLDLLKGLDVEEALLGWSLAALLWHSRDAFWVRHEPVTTGRALRRAAKLLGATALAGIAAVAAAASHARGGLSPAAVPDAALSLLTITGGPSFRAPFRWLPEALAVLGAGGLGAAAAALLAPLRPQRVAAAVDRHRAATLVRRHGSDTLSAFKLRGDLARRFSPDGRAMVAYRIEAGALLVAGDPVGPPDALVPLLDDLIAFARRHGLALGAVGASEDFSVLARRAGLHRLYLGDEAIVATGAMDLSGGAHKSLRKAVNRIARHGFTASVAAAGELDAGTLEQLAEVSARWRDGAPERGFSMAHDALRDELLPDAAVVIARDADGRVRGFLHFVPVFGRPAMSLAFMRRDRDTPNGLTDFLVVEAARLLGERGIAEVSLNFAACGRWLREPANPVERLVARVLRFADSFFQIERLLRFNAKFQPRWQPRYLLFARPAQLPRVALAALWVEGQLPRPQLPRLARRRAALPTLDAA